MGYDVTPLHNILNDYKLVVITSVFDDSGVSYYIINVNPGFINHGLLLGVIFPQQS